MKKVVEFRTKNVGHMQHIIDTLIALYAQLINNKLPNMHNIYEIELIKTFQDGLVFKTLKATICIFLGDVLNRYTTI